MAAWPPRRLPALQQRPVRLGGGRGARAGGRGALAAGRRSTPDALLTRLGLPQAGLPPLPASTTFATLDQDGNAVACALTMDNLFGTGRIVPGTRLPARGLAGRVPPPLYAAAIAWNDHLHAFRAAVGGSGQAGAPMAVAVAMLNALRHRAGDGGAGARSRARQRHRLRELSAGRRPAVCRWATDPRGAGLAVGGN